MPSISHIPEECQALFYQRIGGDGITPTERYPARDPGVEGYPILVVQFPVERQALFQQRTRPCEVVPFPLGYPGKSVEGRRDASGVSEFTGEGEAVLPQCLCPINVALRIGEARSSTQGHGPHRSRHCGAARQGLLQKGSPLTLETTHVPKHLQRFAKTQGNLNAWLCSLWFKGPLQRCSQVVMLSLEPLQPHDLLRTRKLRRCFLCQREVVRGMSLTSRFHLPSRGEGLQSVLANRLQYREAEFLSLFCRLL